MNWHEIALSAVSTFGVCGYEVQIGILEARQRSVHYVFIYIWNCLLVTFDRLSVSQFDHFRAL